MPEQLKTIFSKVTLIFLVLSSSSLCFAQVDCFPRNDDHNARTIVASHYSPYLGPIYITNLSSLILGLTMPTGVEEIKRHQNEYDILGVYGVIQILGMQVVHCGAVGKRPAQEFYKIENIDANYYRQMRKYFWWSYGLNITAISYMASISEKEDRWNRVAGVVLAPWIFDLLINRIFYPYKYQLYESPVFLNIQDNPETKEQTVSLNLSFKY